MTDAQGCPVLHTVELANAAKQWWPNQVNLKVLDGPAPNRSPYGPSFEYRAALASLDVEALRRDLIELMTTSQPWWPADFGHYGPLFIRMAWHSAGTYRIADGRGGASRGAQRFAPVGSWPDNANLDKARRLLWPIKQRYGRALSWADLIVFAGNVALEAMGLRTIGFAFGREDAFEPPLDTYWGPERTWLGDERHDEEGELENPFGAVQMGLIYVNPEGPSGHPDPLAAARDIRETFRRMAMNDAETVALIVGGHTFGKFHGAAPASFVGPEPDGAPLEQQGLGWRNTYGTGMGNDTYTGGPEGIWTPTPTQWDNTFLEQLFAYDWELERSPAGAYQWTPRNPEAQGTVPDAHDPTVRHAPTMLTTDLALREDPIYREIALRFRDHPDELADAFARAWFKLIHRDLGPVSRYQGPLVPSETFVWQDPVPPVTHGLVGEAEIAELKDLIRASGLTTAELVRTAWASASTFRTTDRRGGANGARIRLLPQRTWAVNDPAELARVLAVLEAIKVGFDERHGPAVGVSLADLIVLGGVTAVEDAARAAGVEVSVPFTPGRTDATEADTDAESFAVLEPRADGFRNWARPGEKVPLEHLLVERACRMGLNAPQMVVLVLGMRALGANAGGSPHGVLTERPGVLSTDVVRNLLDMGIEWRPATGEDQTYVGVDRVSGAPRWTASAVDLVLGANAELRAICEAYASDDGQAMFVRDFVEAWDAVMMADRFDVR
ncbi:catalase/peroxidase HPI [Acidimicrobium ferrooxidans]